MKIIIPGGSGQVGHRPGPRLSPATGMMSSSSAAVRSPAVARRRLGRRDARRLGAEIDGADVVINLAGRSVNCRYNAAQPRGRSWSRV